MDNPKRLLPFATGLLLLGVAFFLLYQRPIYAEFSGSTMGTRYQVKISNLPRQLNQLELEKSVLASLDQVDRLMSTYKPESDVSRFNHAPIDQIVMIDPLTLSVIQSAKKVYDLSNGAFDITVAPVVRLWGFGPDTHDEQPPSEQDIERALAKTGFKKIIINTRPPSLIKTEAVEIDLSAIAKGFAVDQVARLLDEQKVVNYLIEVGGEIRVRGHNPDGQRWRIGIETPSPVRSGMQKAVAIKDASVATSGDYRNFFEYKGKRYSHTINPVTGKPVEHNLASITLVMPSCAEADAYATAISVLGPERGYALAEKLNLSAYFLIREGDGFRNKMTPVFRDLFEANPHKN